MHVELNPDSALDAFVFVLWHFCTPHETRLKKKSRQTIWKCLNMIWLTSALSQHWIDNQRHLSVAAELGWRGFIIHFVYLMSKLSAHWTRSRRADFNWYRFELSDLKNISVDTLVVVGCVRCVVRWRRKLRIQHWFYAVTGSLPIRDRNRPTLNHLCERHGGTKLESNWKPISPFSVQSGIQSACQSHFLYDISGHKGQLSQSYYRCK